MAEIRSTLDIIMEKAKEVDVTDEDRIAFKRQELEGKIRGFLQKFQDQILSEERLMEEVKAIGMQKDQMVREIFTEDCFSRIDPEADNTRLIGLMERVAGVDTGPILDSLNKYRDKITRERGRSLSALSERLRERGISGSAVLPNLEADPLWMNEKAKMRQDFLNDLMALRL